MLNLHLNKGQKMRRIYGIFFVFCFTLTFITSAYPQTPPPSQTGGGLQKQEQQIQTERQLEKQIKEKRKKPEDAVIEEKPGQPIAEGQKNLISKIVVEGVTLIPKDVVDKIIEGFEGKELGVKEMQEACDRITDEYRTRGRVTSRAYLPPQTIKDGVLTIIVVEGKMGNVDVRENKFFSATQVKKKLKLKPGDFLDYKSIQKTLIKINENPDIFVKAGLVPGKEAGTTDLILKVQDRLPIHIGYEFDNYGSRYIGYQRHSITAEDNNLFGLYDKLSFKYQKAQEQFYDSTSLSYVLPVFDFLDFGAYGLWSTSKLGKEYKALNVKGYSTLWGVFGTFNVIDMNAVNFKIIAGFDYKNINNYTSGVKTSRDNDRVVKVGANLDVSDRWGRTILTIEEDVGVLGGGLYKKDPLATRPGAGAEFQKLTGNLYRLQPMPFSSTILWRNQFQVSNYNLLSVEQFQVGGISNVRAYAPAEYTGDQGLSSTIEWSFPPYFLPKDFKIPNSKSTLYDATRLIAFYDMGYVWTKNPMAPSKKDVTIQGWGGALRFNLAEGAFAKLEFSYRIDRKAQFDSANLYIDVGAKF
jgi:hemolysin activation/secretion protein